MTGFPRTQRRIVGAPLASNAAACNKFGRKLPLSVIIYQPLVSELWMLLEDGADNVSMSASDSMLTFSSPPGSSARYQMRLCSRCVAIFVRIQSPIPKRVYCSIHHASIVALSFYVFCSLWIYACVAASCVGTKLFDRRFRRTSASHEGTTASRGKRLRQDRGMRAVLLPKH